MTETYPDSFDIIVVGAGHAGVEASLVACRLESKVLLLTQDTDAVGRMSCNPAVGGIAKGQLAAEVDIFGGIIARAADRTGLHFKVLNLSKGVAVQSPRVQCDRVLYSRQVKNMLLEESGGYLVLKKGEAVEVAVDDKGVCGVVSDDGFLYKSRAVIIAAGTFLNGLLHTGLRSFKGGRISEPPAERLSGCLEKLGIKIKRFKTGTPPRLKGDTIDFSVIEKQISDEDFRPISIFTKKSDINAGRFLPCGVTYTDGKTRDVIKKNLDRSPLYSGVIKSTGPRYCPSIEDKIVRFPQRERHQVFLEPEGFSAAEYYPNGISTSLPEDVQIEIVHSLKGCERALITRFGYAVEYDYFPPEEEVYHTLESKKIPGLYFAGQVNGTTGYEEAAALGLAAGINAVLKIRGKEPFVVGRDEGYIGVLIDDLVTKGVLEPYRLFTSRAEYRLSLRWDNVDLRLMPAALALGIFDDKIRSWFYAYRDAVEDAFARMSAKSGVLSSSDSDGRELDKLKKEIAKKISYHPDDIKDNPWTFERAVNEVAVMLKYDGYIKRERESALKMKKLESRKITSDFDYNSIKGILNETREKLNKIRPATLGQAMRVSGVTPSDAMLIAIHLNRSKNEARGE